MNTMGINAEFLQFFLGGGPHAQLPTKITVYLKQTWCLLISKVDMLGQFFLISQILASVFPI